MMFTPEMDALIQEHYVSMPLANLCDLLDVDDPERIYKRAATLRNATGKPERINGYRFTHAKYYTEREDNLVIKLMDKLDIEQLARRLGRSRSGARNRVTFLRNKLGLKASRRKATEAEEKFVTDKYAAGMSYVGIAERLGWTRSQVAGKIRLLRDRGVIKCRRIELRQLPARRGQKRAGGHAGLSNDGPRSASLPSVSINAQRS
jgi:predicted transcriptional regulator